MRFLSGAIGSPPTMRWTAVFALSVTSWRDIFDAVEVGTANQEIDVARERGMSGVGFLHVDEDGEAADQFVQDSCLGKRVADLVQDSDDIEQPLFAMLATEAGGKTAGGTGCRVA